MSTIKTGTTLTTAYQVVGDTTGALVIQTGASPTTAMTIDGSQNVGIGTDTPAYKLDVVSATDGTLGEFKSTSTANNTALRFGLSGPDAYISAAGDNTNLTLLTDGTEKVRLTNAGNVGIGTSSPSQKLHVSGGLLQVTRNTQNMFLNPDYNSGGTTGALVVDTGKVLAFMQADTERSRIDSSGVFYFDSGYGSSAKAYGCRAWVNFNGTGTVAIRASGNVSSITDNGTGDYTVNMTTAMPDANYGWIGTARNADTGTLLSLLTGYLTQSTSAFRMRTTSEANGARDSIQVSVSVFR